MAELTPITLASPQLEDAALLAIQTVLESRLSWLSTAYGRAQRLVEEREGRLVYSPGYPAVDPTGKEYIPLFPDERKGNFSFFDLRDEQAVESWGKKDVNKSLFRFNASLIVWWDFRTVYPSPADWKQYSTANVVREVFDALARVSTPFVSVVADRYFENVENVYRSYTHNEVKNQFAMRPYGCVRIDLQIGYTPECP